MGLKYQHSEEEKEDVLKAYVEAEGDLDAALDVVMLSDSSDIGRFVQDYIRPAIDEGLVERYPSFEKYANVKREKKKAQPKKRAKIASTPALGKPAKEDSLTAMIQARRSAS